MGSETPKADILWFVDLSTTQRFLMVDHSIGKILKDDDTVASYNIEEKGFVVCMISKVGVCSSASNVPGSSSYNFSRRKSLRHPPLHKSPYLQLRQLRLRQLLLHHLLPLSRNLRSPQAKTPCQPLQPHNEQRTPLLQVVPRQVATLRGLLWERLDRRPSRIWRQWASSGPRSRLL